VSIQRTLRFKARAGRILLALLVISAAAGVVWYRRLPPDEAPPATLEAPGSGTMAEMVSRDFRHVETRMDRTVWILEADRAEVFEENARLHAVKITWYGEPGTVPMVITSREGQVDFRKRNARLSGAVRIERADGAVIETEQLAWDEGSNLLRAPQSVLITTPAYTFRGTSLDADITERRVTLKGRVHGEIRGLAALPRPS